MYCRCDELLSQLTKHSSTTAQLHDVVAAFTTQASSGYYEKQADIANAIARLESYECRLQQATERVKMLMVLQKRKDVHLRNTQAAITADR
jgi:hypothetical protein